MKATVTSKGQITIPLAVRRKLKLVAGSMLDFDEEADHLKAFKRTDTKRMRSALGLQKTSWVGSRFPDGLKSYAARRICRYASGSNEHCD